MKPPLHPFSATCQKWGLCGRYISSHIRVLTSLRGRLEETRQDCGKAVQISEPFEGLTRLCRLICGKPLAFRLNPPRSTLRAGWKAEPSSQRRGGWSRASATERQSLSAHQAAEPRVADGGLERNLDKRGTATMPPDHPWDQNKACASHLTADPTCGSLLSLSQESAGKRTRQGDAKGTRQGGKRRGK